MTQHLLDIAHFARDDIIDMLTNAARPPVDLGRPLAGRGVALIFEKPSTRTRHSTEIAVVELGGHPVYARGEEIGLGTREPIADITRILQGYHAILAARVDDHASLVAMAAVADVPVVNLLSDHSHPLQALADALTMIESSGALDGATVAWVGDYTNVARSLGEVCAVLGAAFHLACPPGFDADEAELDRLRHLGKNPVEQSSRPAEAVEGADFVHTDTWVSMGREADETERIKAFDGFCVDRTLMDAAAPGAKFMHCLPAHRGTEVSADVIDGPRSLVFQQGHNRLHAARGAMAWLLGVRP